MAIWTRYSSAMNTNNQYIKYRVKLTLNSQNVTNNTSNVTVEIQVWRTNTGYTTYGHGTCYVTIDGTQYTSSITNDHKFTYNSYTVVFSRTLNITHNTDGTKTLNISAYISHSRFSSSSQSYSTSLDTIPRVSSVSASSGSVNFGKSVTINISRHSSSFTHRLRYSVAGQSGTIATGVGTSYSWSVPTSLINGISNNDRATCTIYCDTYSGSTNIGTKSTTVTLIIPVSSVSLSASSVNYGSSVTINISRAHSKLTHRIRYNWNNKTGTIVSSTSSTSYSWTVPNSFMNYIPNSTSTTGTIYVDTYNGTKSVGTKSVSLKTNVPSSVVPSFSSIGHSEQNSAVAALNLGSGVYARNLSKIKFTINGASGTYSSTIKSYKIVYDGTTYNSSSATTGTIKNSGTRTVTATITDSRGRTASKSTTVSVLAYNSPSISSFSVRRCNEDGSNNDMGEYIKVTYGGSISNLNNENTATVYIDTKPRSSSTWTTKNSFAITGSFSGTKIFGTYEIIQSYDVRIRVVDKFYTVTSTQQLSTAVVTMSWGKQGVGIGKVWERGALDVGGKIYADGIDIPDTRDVADEPQDLPSKAISFAFKRNSTIGNPPVTAANSYSHIIRVAGWNTHESSGGWPTELSVGTKGIAYRQATSATAWGAWKKIWSEDNDGSGSGLDADLLDGKNSSYFQPASDERLKTDIQPITTALEKVLALQGVSFVWNEKAEEIEAKRETLAGREIGLIAQQVAEVVPEVVLDWIDTSDGETYKTVDTSRIVALLIEAIKELNTKIEEKEE
jgi:hypothetical protein